MSETKVYTSLSTFIQDAQPDLKGNVEHPFLKDLHAFHEEKKHYSDQVIYDTSDMDAIVSEKVHKGEIFKVGDFLKGEVSKEVCGSNTQDIVAARLEEDLNWGGLVKNWGGPVKDLIRPQNAFTFTTFLGIQEHDDILVKGELTAPLVESVEEKGIEEETNWFCKGCSKYFSTKASLKRHHDRKKSCKEICEKPAVEEKTTGIPDKPYIVDWVDQIMTKAISGDLDKPYCKHCEVEFANKSNLNKHLTKSIACDRLAKQEFVKFLTQT